MAGVLAAELYVSDMAVAEQALLRNDMSELQRIISSYLTSTPVDAGFELRYLFSVCQAHQKARRLSLPYKACSLDISRDGAIAAVGMSNDSVVLVDLLSGATLATYGPGDQHWAFTSVSLSAMGESVAFSQDENVVVMSTDRKGDNSARVLQGHQSTVVKVAFSDDDARIASVSLDGHIRIWKMDDGSFLQSLNYPDHQLWSVAWSPDQQLIAAGSEDGLIHIWRWADGQVLHTLSAHEGTVESVAFAPDGRILASGGLDHAALLWDVESGERLGNRMMHSDSVFCVRFEPDGRFLASASRAGDVKIWLAKDTTEVKTLRRHSGIVAAIAISDDGQKLASASDDYTVAATRFDPDAAPDTIATTFYVEQMALTVDGRWLCYIAPGLEQHAGDRGINEQRQVMVWDMSRHEHATPIAVDDLPTRIAVSPSGCLAVAYLTGGVQLWNLESRQKRGPCLAVDATASSIAFRSTDDLLACGQEDGSITLWDTQTGNRVGHLLGHNKPIRDLRFSQDGSLLAAGSDDFTATVWDPSRRALVRRCSGHRAAVMCVDLSPDGRILATGGWDNDVRLWNTTDAERSGADQRLGKQALWVSQVQFSPDGRFLFSAGGDHTVRIWNMAARRQQFSLAVGSAILAMAMTPDGNTLITGGRDNAVRFWRGAQW